MHETTLIAAQRLHELLSTGPRPVILDCGFELTDPQAGQRAYAAGHLPGAQQADLERHLSGPKHPLGPRDKAFTGRHPLPSREALAQQLGQWGITPQTPVVCYDDQGGAYAARAWWLLRWMGHGAVAVLDGGKAAWVATVDDYDETYADLGDEEAAIILMKAQAAASPSVN